MTIDNRTGDQGERCPHGIIVEPSQAPEQACPRCQFGDDAPATPATPSEPPRDHIRLRGGDVSDRAAFLVWLVLFVGACVAEVAVTVWAVRT